MGSGGRYVEAVGLGQQKKSLCIYDFIDREMVILNHKFIRTVHQLCSLSFALSFTIPALS